jgi:hypothetical protein
MQLPATTERVQSSTAPRWNQEIAARTEASVAWHADHPEAIEARLEELAREWDIERTLQANAASLSLLGVALGAGVDRRFLVLPFAVGAFLLQHALQGWCPPLPILRRRGVRSQAEIAEERYALKALRGDFDGVAAQTGEPGSAVARTALAAAQRRR